MFGRRKLKPWLAKRPSFDQLFLAGVLLVAAFLRFYELTIKPIHFDEGINGHFVQETWRLGYYPYDPSNFHGPLYFYLLQFSEMIFGRGIFSFRMVSVGLSLALIVTLFSMRKWYGRAAHLAVALVAVSPAFTFYSRYAIHESLFILAQVLFFIGCLLFQSGEQRKGFSLMVAMAVVLAATKETVSIYFVTVIVASLLVNLMYRRGWVRVSGEKKRRSAANVDQPRQADFSKVFEWSVIGLGCLALVFIYSGGFQKFSGVLDFFKAFTFWAKVGSGGAGHQKPWYYWLSLMSRYEYWALVALGSSLWLAFSRSDKVTASMRLLAFLALGTVFVSSCIPYKTPWLILCLLWPLALTMGLGFEHVRDRIPKIAGAVVAVGLLGVALYSSWQLNFFHYEDNNEPYVYVQTTNEFKIVMQTIEKKRAAFPEALNLPIDVLNRDTWPLPWVLGLYTQVAFTKIDAWTKTKQNPAVVLIDSADKQQVESQLKGSWYIMPFQIRHSYTSGFAYLRADQFADVVPPGAPEAAFSPAAIGP